MKITELRDRSILILGLGLEGRSTWRYLRTLFPEKILGLADRLPLEKVPPETAAMIKADSQVRLHLGEDHRASLMKYDVVAKSPGIALKQSDYQSALSTGIEI